MTRLLITAIAIAIPTCFYAWLVRQVDRFEKEPFPLLIGAFLWGALPAVIMAILWQTALDIPISLILGDGLRGEAASSAIGAPVTEEILKGTAVALIYFTRRKEFDGWVDGIVYGATAGFGFAYVENILYLMGTESTEEWITLFFLRVLVLGFMHGFWTALTGIGFGIARHLRNPFLQSMVIMMGLLAAIAGHMIHNGSLVLVKVSEGQSIFVTIANYAILILLMLSLSVVAAFNDRRLLKKYLQDEVPLVLSPAAYVGICSPKANALTRFRLSSKEKRALIQTAAELAQKKRQLAKLGEEGGNSTMIEQLRVELKELGAKVY